MKVEYDIGVTDTSRNPNGSGSYCDHLMIRSYNNYGFEVAYETFGESDGATTKDLYWRRWYGGGPDHWKKVTCNIVS